MRHLQDHLGLFFDGECVLACVCMTVSVSADAGKEAQREGETSLKMAGDC